MGRYSAIEMRLAARAPETAVACCLTAGTVVGDWRVKTFLGRGLSAEVYLVTNVRFEQEGALKLLIDGTRGLRERFLTEADAIRFLALRALPRFMGSGEFEGRPYYVMEYLQPLPEPISRREVPSFMNRVAKAVQTLHDAGYIHRDLKPGNVLRRKNGEPVLIDLGLIKKRGLGVTDAIVRHGRGISLVDGKPVGVGTLDYAAPEQLLKGESSVQSDVFALGKMLRYFYEGHPPRSVRGIIRQATRELPGDRFASAEAFAAALRHRNRLRYVACFSLVAIVLAVLLFPLVRPHVVPRLIDWLSPVRFEFQHVQRPDESESEFLTRMLARALKDDAQAQVAVAEAYFYGRGVSTNRAEAVRWYQVAAEAGESDAQASLGLCLFRGWGTERDVRAAVGWWRRAAEQGNLSAMGDYAYCLLHGFGCEKDEKSGFSWALRAAESGNGSAQTLVGECYLEGRGIEQDLGRGETWLYRAARQGNRRARNLLRTR